MSRNLRVPKETGWHLVARAREIVDVAAIYQQVLGKRIGHALGDAADEKLTRLERPCSDQVGACGEVDCVVSSHRL